MKEEKPFSGFAITGFVLSICGIFFILFSILGIIFSALALKNIKEGKKKGKGLAIAGLVMGIVFTALALLALIVIGSIRMLLG